MKLLTLLLFPILFFSVCAYGDIQNDAVTFEPPQGWRMADTKALPPGVKIMVVGKGRSEFPPSINLSTEPYSGTLKDYLEIVKEINASQGAEWKDLGTIQTKAGTASLSQVENKTEWGDVRMMHTILIRNETTYILTAAALRDEFTDFYQDFFSALRSLDVKQQEPAESPIEQK